MDSSNRALENEHLQWEGVGAVSNGSASESALKTGSSEDLSSEGGDQMCDVGPSSVSLLYSAPSCISDFTERWVTEVMRQYYMTQFGQKSPLPLGIGGFSVEMAGHNNENKDDQDDAEIQVSLIVAYVKKYYAC